MPSGAQTASYLGLIALSFRSCGIGGAERVKVRFCAAYGFLLSIEVVGKGVGPVQVGSGGNGVEPGATGESSIGGYSGVKISKVTAGSNVGVGAIAVVVAL